MLLASASESVLLWDASSMARPERKATTHGDSIVRSVRWNHDNMALASSAEDGSVCLSTEGTTRDLMASEKSSSAVSLALSFSADSSYLAAGGDDGVVRVWGFSQAGRPRRLHAHTSPVSCVCWAPTDQHQPGGRHDSGAPLLLTAGSELGEITTHTVLGEGAPVCASRLVLSDGQRPIACTAVQYSPLRQTTLASADSAGCVRLWDLVSARGASETPLATHEFCEHEQACTDLAWSWVNHLLLVSVGADGQLVFYDCAQLQAVKRVQLGEPLTCASFLADGVTIAVGTERGSIHLFDLRMSLTPMRSAVASDAWPVFDLTFQHAEPEEGSRSAPRVESAPGGTRAPAAASAGAHGDAVARAGTERVERVGHPVRSRSLAASQAETRVAEQHEPSEGGSGVRPLHSRPEQPQPRPLPSDPARPALRSLENAPVAARNGGEAKPATSSKAQAPPAAAASTPAAQRRAQPADAIAESSASAARGDWQGLASRSAEPPSTAARDSLPRRAARPGAVEQTPWLLASPRAQPQRDLLSPSAQQSSELPAVAHQLVFGSQTGADASGDEKRSHTPAAADPQASSAPAISVEEVRSLLSGALADTRESLHADIRDVHVELLRQFQIMQVRFGDMMESNARQVAGLRQEIAELRHRLPADES